MSPSFLTREGYQKLQDELDYLRNIKRKEIADRLHEAMDDGELIDNAEYEAAKNEQAFVEGRIKELEILLANARVIDETHISTEVVQIGSTVTIQEEGIEPEIYTIVGTAEADPRAGRISNESPLGKAVLGHKTGDQISVEAPEGSYKVQIIKVE
jgi:transcription elongation factor GreA